MRQCLFDIDREECSRLAHDFFMADSGLSREGRKFDRMREDALRMRTVIEERVRIRALGIYSEDISFSGRTAVIEGVDFTCSAFELIDPATVKGAYMYALCRYMGQCLYRCCPDPYKKANRKSVEAQR